MVGKQGLEPRLPGPRLGALTLTPHPGRDPRSRTAFLLIPDQADYRLPRSRDVLLTQHGGDGGNRTRCDDACRACPLPQLSSPWNWRDLNARPPACHAGALPTELQPQGAMRRPVQPVPECSWAFFRRIAKFGRHGGLPFMVLTLWRCQQASTFTLGWCSAGTAGVEPAFRSGWSRAAYPVADPQVNENRPSGIPGAAALSWPNGLSRQPSWCSGQARAASTGSCTRLASRLSGTSWFDGKR